MRSSLAILALVAAPGCDVVFGLDSDIGPCGSSSFDGATETMVQPETEVFSVTRDGDFGVFQQSGQLRQRALPDGELAPVDFSIYQAMQLGLSPEGDAMFFTAAIEPPKVFAGTHEGLAPTWDAAGVSFHGSSAGIPSAAEFGPRRVIVRETADASTVQEYRQAGDAWEAVGDPHELLGRAPNLTPSGLDIVFQDAAGIEIAHRASTDEWFGDPTVISTTEAANQPVLVGRCTTLFVVHPYADGTMLKTGVFRYDR